MGRDSCRWHENRLTAYMRACNVTTFLYDGDGGRVKKTTNGVATLYIGKLDECVLPCIPDDTATQYVFAGGERIASRITGGAPRCFRSETWCVSVHPGLTSEEI